MLLLFFVCLLILFSLAIKVSSQNFQLMLTKICFSSTLPPQHSLYLSLSMAILIFQVKVCNRTCFNTFVTLYTFSQTYFVSGKYIIRYRQIYSTCKNPKFVVYEIKSAWDILENCIKTWGSNYQKLKIFRKNDISYHSVFTSDDIFEDIKEIFCRPGREWCVIARLRPQTRLI